VGEDLTIPMALDFLDKWPRLTDVQASKDITLKNFYHRHNVRRSELIQSRIESRRSARLLTRDPAIIEVSVRIVRMLVAELRVLAEHITEFETAIEEAFAEHPEKSFFRELPGAGPVMAPRLLAAFGTARDLFPDPGSMQRYFGVAPSLRKAADAAGSIGVGMRPSFCVKLSSSGPAKPWSSVPGLRPTTNSSGTNARATTPSCALWPSSGCASCGAVGKLARTTTRKNTSSNSKNATLPSPLAHVTWPSKWPLKNLKNMLRGYPQMLA
jgi:hypothetical protein